MKKLSMLLGVVASVISLSSCNMLSENTNIDNPITDERQSLRNLKFGRFNAKEKECWVVDCDVYYFDLRDTKIVIPSEYYGYTVVGIEEYAFKDYIPLKEIVVPETVRDLSYYCFSNCANLTSITLPDSIDRLDLGIFSGCIAITTFKCPRNLRFLDCHTSYITTIYIPSSVQGIAYYGFPTSIKEIFYSGSEQSWKNIYFSIMVPNDAVIVHFNYNY